MRGAQQPEKPQGGKYRMMHRMLPHDFTRKRINRRQQRLEQHINRYLAILDEADKREPEERKYSAEELKEKIASMQEEMKRLNAIEAEVETHPDTQVSLTDPDSRSMAMRSWPAKRPSRNPHWGIRRRCQDLRPRHRKLSEIPIEIETR